MTKFLFAPIPPPDDGKEDWMNHHLVRRKAEQLRNALIAADVVRSPDECPFDQLPEDRKRNWLALATVYLIIFR